MDREIGAQYEGFSPSDPSVDQYFALAEEFYIPVAIHMGTGGSGRANVAMPKFRGFEDRVMFGTDQLVWPSS